MACCLTSSLSLLAAASHIGKEIGPSLVPDGSSCPTDPTLDRTIGIDRGSARPPPHSRGQRMRARTQHRRSQSYGPTDRNRTDRLRSLRRPSPIGRCPNDPWQNPQPTLSSCSPTEGSFEDRCVVDGPLFAHLPITSHPDDVRDHSPAFPFHAPHTLARAVVRELNAASPGTDGHQLIARIPFVGTSAVGGHIPIRVKRKRLRRARLADLICLASHVSARIRRRTCSSPP